MANQQNILYESGIRSQELIESQLKKLYTELRDYLLAVVHFILPYKTMDYYYDYLKIMESYHFSTVRNRGHRLLPIFAYGAMVIGSYFAINCMWLYQLKGEERYLRFLFADPFHYVLHHPTLSLIVPGLSYMTIYFGYLMFLRVPPTSLAFVGQILNYPFKSDFRLKYLNNGRYQPLEVTVSSYEKGRSLILITDFMRQITLTVVNVLQLYVVAIWIMIVYVWLIFVLETVNFRDQLFYSGINGWLHYGFHLANMIVLILCIGFYGYMSIFAASIFIDCLIYIFILSAQTLQHLKALQQSHHWSPLDHFLRSNVRLFECIFTADYFSSLFFTFIVVHAPTSAFLIMTLLLDTTINLVTGFFLVTIFTQEILCIFGIHFYICQVSKRAHSSAPLLLHLAVHRACKVGNFRARFRMALAIDRLHTKRRYGIHYGNVGLVTYASFAKCLLLYGEVLMYSYIIISHSFKHVFDIQIAVFE